MKQRLYYKTLEDAQKAIETITDAQRKENKFFNIDLQKWHGELFVVIVG